jgi:hypothetical protein
LYCRNGAVAADRAEAPARIAAKIVSEIGLIRGILIIRTARHAASRASLTIIDARIAREVAAGCLLSHGDSVGGTLRMRCRRDVRTSN